MSFVYSKLIYSTKRQSVKCIGLCVKLYRRQQIFESDISCLFSAKKSIETSPIHVSNSKETSEVATKTKTNIPKGKDIPRTPPNKSNKTELVQSKNEAAKNKKTER